MSDPESAAPPACSSSPPPVPAFDDSSSAAALNYAFLVHSQKTLTQNLPPRVDNKLLARQKRRRTSPEDHAILEAEYRNNPKPDKSVRARIVERVSLGEKEVQIWFQNRRQNDRRKSKPLQPHELLAPRVVADQLRQGTGLSGEDVEESGVASLQSSFESDPASDDKDEPEESLQSSQTTLATEPAGDVEQQPEAEAQAEAEAPGSTGSVEKEDMQPEDAQLSSAKRKRSITDLRGEMSQVQPTLETDASKVKSTPSLRLSMSFDGEATVRKEGELTPSPPKGRNALRISMSSDGKAVIRTDDEPSPSKNRISMFSTRTSRFAGLRRSNSAILPRTPRAAGPGEKERVFGRSRDPRNWESMFDTDARSALSTPGSVQSVPHGNVRGPRSLTRSLSSRQNVYANSPVHGHPDTPVPVQQTGDKRRKLSRTVSSLGRLESNRVPMGSVSGNTLKLTKTLSHTKKDSEGLELSYGDSDKENWIPGTRMSHVRRRTTASSHPQRPVLREANNSRAAGRRSRLSQGHPPRKSVSEVGPEVASFMAGGADRSASQEEDLDCIQGLLSLSQGAWR